MSFHCSQQDCPNNKAQFPPEAAEKFAHKCFLCESELVQPDLTIENLLDGVNSLPIALQILPRLQALLNDENVSMTDIISVTRIDASLVTRIISVSNTAYYAMAYGGPCSTLEEALNRIGFIKAHRVVGNVAAKEIFQKNLPLYELTGEQMWQSSVRSAFCMQALVPRMKVSSESYENPDASTAYTVGLLAPIGKMVISHAQESHNFQALQNVQTPITREVEKKVLGFTNPDVASSLLQRWNFEDSVTIPIQFQDRPLKSTGDRPLACLLSLVCNAVDVFPVSDVARDLNSMASDFRPDSQLMAAAGISKMDLLNEITRSIWFVGKGGKQSPLPELN